LTCSEFRTSCTRPYCAKVPATRKEEGKTVKGPYNKKKKNGTNAICKMTLNHFKFGTQVAYFVVIHDKIESEKTRKA
jgi:hypothetical protein